MNSWANNLEKYPDVIQLLTGTSKNGRGLSLDTLKYYNVGVTEFDFPSFVDGKQVWLKEKCITFPWTRLPLIESGSNEIIIDRVKVRSVINKGNQRLIPPNAGWGFFGWHTIPATTKEIVITEGEYDAMAVYEATKLPAISLPNGARSLPVDLLPCVERFVKIYLWMDYDTAGQEGAEQFSKKLGMDRTYLVKNKGTDGPNDANAALLDAETDIKKMILQAEVFPHEQIISFSNNDLRKEVFREFSEIEVRKGVQSTTLPSFNKFLKGHRRGELTILTGTTGIGKTTILSQLSIDFCAQGVTTLWGSFELKLPRLIKTMLNQFSGQNLAKSIDDFPYWADKFEELPLHF